MNLHVLFKMVWSDPLVSGYYTAKYGYKQIKRIGLFAYTNEKPDDY